MSIRVLLVDDQEMIRMGFRMVLGTAEGIEVVGEASDGDEVLDVLAEHPADVVLMDVRMPRIDGIEATRRVMALEDPPHVLVLTTFDLTSTPTRPCVPGRRVSCSRTRRWRRWPQPSATFTTVMPWSRRRPRVAC